MTPRQKLMFALMELEGFQVDTRIDLMNALHIAPFSGWRESSDATGIRHLTQDEEVVKMLALLAENVPGLTAQSPEVEISNLMVKPSTKFNEPLILEMIKANPTVRLCHLRTEYIKQTGNKISAPTLSNIWDRACEKDATLPKRVKGRGRRARA